MSYGTQAITGTGTPTTPYQKETAENVVTITICGTTASYTGVTFTFEASVDNTNWNQIAVIDNGTGALVTAGTSISPSNSSTYSWTLPLALNYVGVRANVSAYSTGTANLKFFGITEVNGPILATTVATTGSFTNVTASGTLAVTGAATFGSSILSSSPSGRIGYTTGAGGAVTQSTNKATGVTLNKTTGQITLNNASLASSATVTFVLTNSAVTATSFIHCWVISGESTPGSYGITATEPSAGTININVRNVTAGSLGEAIVVGFIVFNGGVTS